MRAYGDAGLLSPVRAGTAAEAATSDTACLQAMLDVEAALALAQVRLGSVPAEAGRAIRAAARAEDFDLPELARRGRESANPVVALVAVLADRVAALDPAAAHYVHQGSTSQDVLDTALMLVASRALEPLLIDLDRTAAALRDLAVRHRDTVMPARTLGQHAVPTTFGLKAAGWLQGVMDAADRLRDLHADGLPVQLGGAAGTMAGYLEYAALASRSGGVPQVPAPGEFAARLPALVAARLGLANPLVPWQSVRTPLLGLAAALCGAATALGTVAADVQLLARTETGELSEPGAAGRGASSAMPHKRNPALSALVRSAAYQVPSMLATLAHTAVVDDERPAGAWHAEWQPLRECLRLVGGAARTAAELAEGLVVHEDRMAANLRLTRGLVVSERLAAVLAADLGRAEAKAVVGGASALAAADGRHLADVLAELLAGRPDPGGRFDAAALHALCGPERYTGAAGLFVDRVVARHDARGRTAR
ncbi:lyase family protein [Streptomyces sp. NRRL S-87]|uniref:lyase family protein n=1 Tax=Streptomyces sp. NRRL S-87 TaxID=1463920 RepID=UPI0004C166EA|nr:lyase family protein [Streptomyces sp. NRRL S-87]